MKTIKEAYNEQIRDGVNPYTELGKAIIANIKDYGMGVLPKADMEGLVFHCICNAIEHEYDNDVRQMDYDLMHMLRITPTKLRSLRVTRSAKYLNDLSLESPKNQLRIITALRNAPLGNEDILNGKIKISVADPHVQNLIERMVEENKGIMDMTFNSKLLTIRAKDFLDIVAMVFDDGGDNGYELAIIAMKEEAHEIHDELTKENIFEKFKDAFQEHAYSKLIEIGCNVAWTAAKRKIGLE